ncbi:hypothetical protein F5X96DRAFT_674006 [Biscogniauxia mediterranea]|nr:hypothetical protein F5X96DRAFT_674006 [Biscogniauxia mediterranea]
MVQVLRSPSLGPNMPNSPDMMEMTSRFMNTGISPIQEEQAGYDSTTTTTTTAPTTKEGNFVKNGSSRGPRRAFTSTDYQLPASPVALALQAQQLRLMTPSPSGTPNETPEAAAAPAAAAVESYFQNPWQAAIASSLASPRHPSPVSAFPPGKGHAASLRPPMASPQRSYSLMDVEPVPFTHQPGTTLTLPLLPPELHYAIFDFLDPIDGTCLALTSKHFYAIYRHVYPGEPVSLAARREGPNDMEWVWRNAGPFVAASGSGSNGSSGNSSGNMQNSLAMLSPRGQVYCRKCRTQRCELHKHIREWMGDGREYCEVTQKFGRAAPPQAKAFCFRSSPKHPHRCGRHTRQQRAVRLV